MRYQPIENHGIIGNMHSAALVSLDGSVDWLCLPRFDSPSVFGAILDADKGGRFRIAPAAAGGDAPEAILLAGDQRPDHPLPAPRRHRRGRGLHAGRARRGSEAQLVRRVRVVRGRLPLEMECRPAFDYARARHASTVSEHGARFDGPGLSLGLASSVPLRPDGGGAVAAFPLGEGQSATFVLRMIDPDDHPGRCPGTGEAEDWFRETVAYWQRWAARCTYGGRWRETVLRSALALKLLTYQPTGAIVAAPTTSLPEGIGGVRNWDYRYTWIRDAAFTVYAFVRIGFTEEAARFRDWAAARYKERDSHGDGPLQLMYAIDGRSDLAEEELPHLDGYMGSRPVRIGNAAHRQLQLDIYGELLDAAYLFNKYVAPIGYDGWRHLRDLVDWVAHNWDREDEGIWEVRGGRRHFVYSKFMCWVALDRGLRLADKRSFPADRAAWLKARDAVYEEVMAKGWSEARGSFVQSYGSDALDASALLMPLTFFMAPNDPRMLATVDAIRRRPPGAGWPPTGWSTATTRRPRRTGCRGWRGRSTCAASGSWRR